MNAPADQPIRPTCPRCRDPLVGIGRPAASAAIGPVLVTLPPRTVADCTARHGTAEAAAVRRGVRGLVRARPRPMGPARCGACRSALDLPPRRSGRAVTVEPPAAAPFTLELSLPLVRCPDCAVDNLPVGIGTLVRRAVRAALD